MKTLPLSALASTLIALSLLLAPATAKEKEKDSSKKKVVVTLAQCPAPVQATILGYKGTVNELEAEQEGSTISYDAKITLPDGKRLKLLIAPDGKVLESKEKKAK